MPIFSYMATDPSGKTATGIMEAPDKDAVIEKLQRERFFPISIEPQRKARKGGLELPFMKKSLSPKETMNFTSQMATLLRSGMEIDRCLNVLLELADTEKGRETIRRIRDSVNSGDTLSTAMGKQKGAFTTLYMSMVRAGETGGFLEKTFDRLAWFIESRMKMIESIKSALVYPAVVALTGFAAILVLATNVIPRFASIFEKMGGELPASTRFLVASSDFILNNWIVLSIVIFAAIAGIKAYISSENGKRKWDALLFRVPLVGDITKKSSVAQFTRTLGTLLQSGVPIVEALEIVKLTLSNTVISDAVGKTIQDVKEGRRISKRLKDTGVFPTLAVHMTLVGEETGTLDEMMLRMAHIYDGEVETSVKRALTLFEPAMILVMGLGVAFIVVSMLTAIVSINDLPF